MYHRAMITWVLKLLSKETSNILQTRQYSSPYRNRIAVFQSEGTFHHIFFFLVCIKDFNSMALELVFSFYTSGDDPMKYLAECKFSYSRLLRAMTSWNLAIQKDRDSKTSLDSILQHTFTFTVWLFFHWQLEFPVFQSVPKYFSHLLFT